jgi:DNA-binding protein
MDKEKVLEMSSKNIVYVGQKPISSYLMAVLKVLQSSNSVKLVARGRAISRAVDVSEIVRNRYLDGFHVGEIQIGSEELEDLNGRIRNVSTISIELARV